MKSEARNPKSEGNLKAEIQNGLAEPESSVRAVVSAGAAPSVPPHRPLPALLLAAGAVLSFHFAYLTPWGPAGMLLFFCFLVGLTRLDTARRAFNYGVGIGLACYAPHLAWMWNIFGVPAVALWMVLPIWLGVFLMLAAFARRRFGDWPAMLLIPVLWLGLEYFRSELYPLKFSWLNVGYALPPQLNRAGMYAAGFAGCLLGATVAFLWRRSWKVGLASAAAILLLGTCILALFAPVNRGNRAWLHVAGIQLEFPNEGAVLSALHQVARKHPEVPLIVLPEYTFDGPVPGAVRAWCRANGKWLIAGGKDPLGTTNYLNTAFVVGTNGDIVFQQAKSVPIQFFRDGLPAPRQRVWESPWGKIGICICYDLSYTRVTDELIRQGAQLIVCPTMDVESWGRYEHELHTRVAPVRAVEYGVPIFRVASSGIAQAVDRLGEVQAQTPFATQGEILVSALTPTGPPAALPLDRRLAPIAVIVTMLIASYALLLRCLGARRNPTAATQN